MSSALPSEGPSASASEQHPSHGYPATKQSATSSSLDKPSTASHPPRTKPDPTVSVADDASQAGLSTSHASATTELARLKGSLRASLRQYPDFPSPGILFEDIMPLFANPKTHENLLRAFELQVASIGQTPDVVVGLEARGFLFGPSLALRLGAAFVPVRKKGKLPGECFTAGYKKEYGEDFFQIQNGTIQNGQKILIVDDVIATGGSAVAAASLVKQAGGTVMGYVFMLELVFLKGRDKLDAPVYTLLSGQEDR